MKTFIFAVAVLISIPLQSVRGASPEVEANFLTAVRQAFDKQDTNALFALICWDRVPDKIIKRSKKQRMREITLKVSEMTLITPDPNEHRQGYKDKEGIVYLPNLPEIKQLKIVFVTDGRFQSSIYSVGEKNGKLYLLVPAPVE
jgi:hypothetical protein